MLCLLAASVAVNAMDLGEPLLRLLEGAATPEPLAIQRGRDRMKQHVEAEAARDGAIAPMVNFGESVVEEGSGKAGVVRAAEKKLITKFYDLGCYNAAHCWDKTKPLARMCGGFTLWLTFTGACDQIVHNELVCPRFLFAENATEYAEHMTAFEACRDQGMALCREYRNPSMYIFTLGVGLGLPLIKNRRYLLNLLLGCKRRDGRRWYEVDDDQKRLNAVQDELKLLLDLSDDYLSKRPNDRTIEMCQSIYVPLTLSVTQHTDALIKARKDLEDIIEYRDHVQAPAKMGRCGLFFYNLKQFFMCNRRNRMTCGGRRNLPLPEEADEELAERRIAQQSKRYVPKAVDDALKDWALEGARSDSGRLHGDSSADAKVADGGDDPVRALNTDEMRERDEEINQLLRDLNQRASHTARWGKLQVAGEMFKGIFHRSDSADVHDAHDRRQPKQTRVQTMPLPPSFTSDETAGTSPPPMHTTKN